MAAPNRNYEFDFNFCFSMHHYIWVYYDRPDANCLVLFYYTSPALHVSDVIYIHPQERHIMHMQPVHVSARVSWKPDTAWNGSTHTCTYMYRLHVHYMTLLRMDVYGIRNM